MPLGGTVSIDGVEVGRMEPFHAGAWDERRTFTLRATLAQRPERLRIDTRIGSGEVYARVARIRIERAGVDLAPRPALAAFS